MRCQVQAGQGCGWCGKWVAYGEDHPFDRDHGYRIVCSGSAQEQIPAGRMPVPEMDRWLAEHRP